MLFQWANKQKELKMTKKIFDKIVWLWYKFWFKVTGII